MRLRAYPTFVCMHAPHTRLHTQRTCVCVRATYMRLHAYPTFVCVHAPYTRLHTQPTCVRARTQHFSARLLPTRLQDINGAKHWQGRCRRLEMQQGRACTSRALGEEHTHAPAGGLHRAAHACRLMPFWCMDEGQHAPRAAHACRLMPFWCMVAGQHMHPQLLMRAG